ncbi:MAG: hypothetical protein JST23_13135 [Bacteroidetes bacterium]|nr:hypothetical protein [Bacteroidota bacterium]
MLKSIACYLLVSVFVLFALQSNGQSKLKEAKPYKVLTSGKQLTIKSEKMIQHVMLWTTNGDRVVEQKDINEKSIVVNVPINRKTFFLMVGLENGKVYTEQIGLP